MVNTQNAFPRLNSEFVDEERKISIPWYRFLVSLWNRTGGASGSISAVLDNIDSTPGAVLYRGTDEWTGLNPGVAGQALLTEGPVSPPQWGDTVSLVNTGAGLDGGPITKTGTISFAPSPDQTMLGNVSGAAAAAIPLSQTLIKTFLNYLGVGDAASGDLTGTYPGPTLGANVVSNAKLAQVPAHTLKGNNTGASASPSDLTVAQVLSMLGLATGPGEPYFIAYLSAPQTVSLATVTKVNFNGTLANVGGYYDNTTNFRFTPLIPGTYLISMTVSCTATPITVLQSFIMKNGSAYASSLLYLPSPSSNSISVSALVQMNGTTDYVEGDIFIGGTGTAKVSGQNAPALLSWLEGHRIGN